MNVRYKNIQIIFLLIFVSFISNNITADDSKTVGKLGKWKETSSLIEPVSKHYSFPVLESVTIFTGKSLSTSNTVTFTSKLTKNELSFWKKSKPSRNVFEEYAPLMKNGYLYIVGGKNMGRVQGITTILPVNPDGTLGFRKTGTFLPEALINLSITENKGYLFVSGGKKGMKTSDKVFSAKINSDSSIEEWKEVTSLPIAVYNHIMFSYKNFIYISGGYHNAGSVYAAKVNDDGTLEKWIGIDDTPVGLERHAGIVVGDYIFVSGGIKNGRAHNGVYAGKFIENGLLISWEKAEALPNPIFNHSMTANSNYLIVSGGISGGREQTKVFISPIN